MDRKSAQVVIDSSCAGLHLVFLTVCMDFHKGCGTYSVIYRHLYLLFFEIELKSRKGCILRETSNVFEVRV